MVQSVREVMTPEPRTLPATATAADAARTMRDARIGDVVVVDTNGNLHGIVTDRDLVVRVVADDRDPRTTAVDDVASKALVTLLPTDTIADAVRVMQEQALRRLPVAEGGKPVGIVSIGDLARQRDPKSVLADISAAPPNR